MKYIIILGFIATIPAVSAILSGNYGVRRVLYPQRWANAIDTCGAGITEAILDIFISYDDESDIAAAKCFALCVYTESGVFVDGGFDPTAIEIFLRQHIVCHHLLEKTVKMFRAAANAGNAKQGSDSDKAWVYHTTFGTPEHQKLWNAVFRPLKDCWQQ